MNNMTPNASMRDGFFVTGDRVREVAPGTYAFVARDNDMIRRRGENIAAVEIDQAALAHPDVGEAAAVGVPSDLGEDDILLAVVARSGRTLDASGLRQFLAGRLTTAKLPRYIAVVDAVPYGPTQRVLRFKIAADTALRAAATPTLPLSVPPSRRRWRAAASSAAPTPCLRSSAKRRPSPTC